jgi:diaminohydroxyphosphoribosylaminopyrimidine deaminase/5-amino-6-(5-phosphoribosylamino)uracil reductase
VHQWRAEEDAIIVGTNTARTDNPRLNVRFPPGSTTTFKNPTRIVIDKQLQLAESLNLFDGTQPTLRYNFIKTETLGQTSNVKLSGDEPFLPQLLADLYERRIQSVLVEGGTTLLNAFLDAGLWDEMRVFRSQTMLHTGVKAPVVRGNLTSRERVGNDELTLCQP